eukprot:evm.model.scf_1418.2 EVM.evm.TU.scf_1418.2   scf_1418:25017-27243(-)
MASPQPVSVVTGEAEGGREAAASSTGRSTGKSLEFTLRQYPCAKMKLDQFFLEWLSMPEYEKVILTVLDNASKGKQLKAGIEEASKVGPVAVASTSVPPSSPTTAPAVSSPRKAALSSQKSAPPSSQSRPPSPAPKPADAAETIPQFYFPKGVPLPDSVQAEHQAKLDALFSGAPDGLPAKEFVKVVKEVVELPGFMAYQLFAKLKAGVAANTALVKRDEFDEWWGSNYIASKDPVSRLYEILCTKGSDYLVHANFEPLLRAVVDHHPSLEFLSDHPEFQDRYMETVIYRIFYNLNRSGTGKLSRRELKRSDFLDVLEQLDSEPDINRVTRYFSYEHFYVIYCKFWELDTDHDFLLDREDLVRYGCHSLTYQIVDRIFDQAPYRFFSRVPGKMSYQDFVWFLLSEEDKTTQPSLEYWFKCIDLDCDGVLGPYDLRPFYEEQLQRMENSACEPVMFEDVMCQLHDLIQPQHEGWFTLKDLQMRRESAGVLFNILFNLHKFLAFEHRDPFMIRAEQENKQSDWDRFAQQEYDILAAEDEQEVSLRDGTDVLAASISDNF